MYKNFISLFLATVVAIIITGCTSTPIISTLRAPKRLKPVAGYIVIKPDNVSTEFTSYHRENIAGKQQHPVTRRFQVFELLKKSSEENNISKQQLSKNVVPFTIANNTKHKLRLWGQSKKKENNDWSDLVYIGLYPPGYNKVAFTALKNQWVAFYAINDEQKEYVSNCYYARNSNESPWLGYQIVLEE